MRHHWKASVAFGLGTDDGVERPGPGLAPTAFRIWRAGGNMTDMGEHTLSKASVETLLASQAERGNLFSIDVDHLSLSPDAPPEARKAVGWHRLGMRQGADGEHELWATSVQWTDAVKSGLESDPPEWRYFSPAYETDKEGNILGYTNTALTNNPATWSVTALASRANTEKHMAEMSDVLAELKEIAAGDGPEAKQAQAMLDTMAEADDAATEVDEAATKQAVAATEDGKKDDEKKDESDDEKATKVAASASTATDLATLLNEHSKKIVRLEKHNVERERDQILASRKDFAPELLKVLRKAPIETVREICASVPKAAPVKHAAAAQATTQASRGATQTSTGDAAGTKVTSQSSRAAMMDARMMTHNQRATVEVKGNRLTFGVMKPKKEGAK